MLLLPDVSDADVENQAMSMYHERYNRVLDLLECGMLFPSFQDVVQAERDSFLKDAVDARIKYASDVVPLPPGVHSKLTDIVRTWNGYVMTLLEKLEELGREVQAIQDNHRVMVDSLRTRRF